MGERDQSRANGRDLNSGNRTQLPCAGRVVVDPSSTDRGQVCQQIGPRDAGEGVVEEGDRWRG